MPKFNFPPQDQESLMRDLRKIPLTTLAGGASATAILTVGVPVGQLVVLRATVYASDATGNDAAVYDVTAAAKNIAGTTDAVGTPDVVALEDDTGWACTAAIDDTNDVITITATPDGSNATKFWGYAWVEKTKAIN